MNYLRNINEWLNKAYEAENKFDWEKDESSFPLQLLVKEVVLDVLWANNWNSETDSRIQRIIDSKDIDSMFEELNTQEVEKVKKEIWENPTSRFLNMLWIHYWENSYFFEALKDDEEKWLERNWRTLYNLWLRFFQNWRYDEAIWTLKWIITMSDIPNDILCSSIVMIWKCCSEKRDKSLYLEWIKYLKWWIRIKDNNLLWEMHNILWELYLWIGELERAIHHFERSLDNNMSDGARRFETKYMLWAMLMNSWFYNRAKKYFRECLMDENINNIYLITIYIHLWWLFWILWNIMNSIKCYEIALNSWIKDGELIEEIHKELWDLYKKIWNKQKAEEYRKK